MSELYIIPPELLPVPATDGGAVEQWIDTFIDNYVGISSHITVVSRPAPTLKRVNYSDSVSYEGIPWTSLERVFFSVKQKLGPKSLIRKLCKIQNVYSYGRRSFKKIPTGKKIYIHNEPNLLLFARKEDVVYLHMHNDHLCNGAFIYLYRHLLKKVEKIIFVSEYLKERATDIYPEYVTKFVVAYNAVDTNKFSIVNGSNEKLPILIEGNFVNLLYAGRLAEIKGVHVLLEAFIKVRKVRCDARLIICGSSFFRNAKKTPYQKKLQDICKGYEESITFTGYVEQNILSEIYRQSDVFVCPSIWQEPQGLVALESMASGTLLVSSAVGGLVELVEHEVNGLLVPANDVDQLASTLLKAVEHPFKEAIESRARKDIESNYTWPILTEKLKRILG